MSGASEAAQNYESDGKRIELSGNIGFPPNWIEEATKLLDRLNVYAGGVPSTPMALQLAATRLSLQLVLHNARDAALASAGRPGADAVQHDAEWMPVGDTGWYFRRRRAGTPIDEWMLFGPGLRFSKGPWQEKDARAFVDAFFSANRPKADAPVDVNSREATLFARALSAESSVEWLEKRVTELEARPVPTQADAGDVA